MQPIDAYLMYCAMKAHFDKSDYDFVKYNGKSKVSRDSFYKRNDRVFFVKLTRKYKSKQDIQDYLLANFLVHPKGWVGKFDEDNYIQWQKKIQSLSYTFKSEIEPILDSKLIAVSENTHPKLLKEYLGKRVSLESMIILDSILGFLDGQYSLANISKGVLLIICGEYLYFCILSFRAARIKREQEALQQ